MSTLTILLLLALFGLMILSAWLYRQLQSQKMKAFAAQTELALLKKSESKESDWQTSMKESFQALAHQTLEGQSQQFIEKAMQSFAQQSEKAEMSLDKKQMAFESIVSPLKQALEDVKKYTGDMEKERQRSYTIVESELKKVVQGSFDLAQETRRLKDALKKPHIRGRWGEVQLKNCIELAGMSEYADVSFQNMNTTDEGNRLIPDMVVKMPGGRRVVVDAKTPLDAFIASLEASTEEQKSVEMQRHGLQVKEHVRKLSQKAYNEHLKDSADFTVMFLPNESFLYAALETQPDLVEYALEKKILIATPPTFIGLLKVIRYGWNEEKLAQNAQVIWTTGQELHKRLVDFVESYVAVGKGLATAQNKYDEGMKRLNSRVLVQVRKLEELGVKGRKDLPEELGEAPISN